MWFWALDERRKWREKWRAEAYAVGYAEGYIQGRAEALAALDRERAMQEIEKRLDLLSRRATDS